MNVPTELTQELLNVLSEQRNELAMQNAMLIAQLRLLSAKSEAEGQGEAG